jgi:hypothetical protein
MKLESIIIYPKNAKQKTMLKSLLEEMKIQFEIASTKDETSLNEKNTNKKNFWVYDLSIL